MKQNQSFVLFSVWGILGILAYLNWKNPNFLLLSILFLAFPIFFENWSNTIHDWWMKFAKILGAFQAKILFGFLFLFVLLPISWIKKQKSNPYPSQNNQWKECEEKEFDFEKLW